MITPQTHPKYFREEKVGPYTYFVHEYHSIGLDEDVADVQRATWRNVYRETFPNDLIDGKIDPKKYDEWEDTDGIGARKVRRTIADLLFIPKGDAPAISSDEGWYMLSQDQLLSVQNFIKPKSQDNTDGQAKLATSGVVSPATQTADLSSSPS